MNVEQALGELENATQSQQLSASAAANIRDETAIGQPRPTRWPAVMRRPSNATPARNTVDAQKSIPEAQLSECYENAIA